MTPALDLERLAHSTLRRLPVPQAPRTLLPRVVAAVKRRLARPWYERAWLTWPRAWQVVSAMALAGVFAGLIVALPFVDTAAGLELLPLVSERARVASAAGRFAVALNAAAVLWRAILEPMLGYVIVLVGLTWTTCAVAGAALAHVTTERMSRS